MKSKCGPSGLLEDKGYWRPTYILQNPCKAFCLFRYKIPQILNFIWRKKMNQKFHLLRYSIPSYVDLHRCSINAIRTLIHGTSSCRSLSCTAKENAKHLSNTKPDTQQELPTTNRDHTPTSDTPNLVSNPSTEAYKAENPANSSEPLSHAKNPSSNGKNAVPDINATSLGLENPSQDPLKYQKFAIKYIGYLILFGLAMGGLRYYENAAENEKKSKEAEKKLQEEQAEKIKNMQAGKVNLPWQSENQESSENRKKLSVFKIIYENTDEEKLSPEEERELEITVLQAKLKELRAQRRSRAHDHAKADIKKRLRSMNVPV